MKFGRSIAAILASAAVAACTPSPHARVPSLAAQQRSDGESNVAEVVQPGAQPPTRLAADDLTAKKAPRHEASRHQARSPDEALSLPASPSPPTPTEIFPHIRLDAARTFIEFDATIPIDAHDAAHPRILLEVIACPPDTKEYEAVLVTPAKPSHLHAALLLLGLKPGKPGAWSWEGEKLTSIPPSGPPLTITARYPINGVDHSDAIAEWVIDARTLKTLSADATAHFLFAGSRLEHRQGAERYRADDLGTLIGLTTFGTETIAWSAMYNPEATVEEPHWIANAATIPPYNTAVTVRIAK